MRMGWCKAMMMVMVVQAAAGAAWAGTDFDQALAIVQQRVLGGDATGKRVYAFEGATSSGMVVQGWRKAVTLPDAIGWVFFIDDLPDANWEHPARIVFVRADSGAHVTFNVTTPPKDFDKFREIGTYKAKARSAKQRTVTSPTARRQAAGGVVEAAANDMLTLGPDHKYAVLISGGYNPVNNHIRYWNDISFIYKTLRNKYGYKASNIYVLYADGLSPDVDNSDGENSKQSLDGDKRPDITGAATKAQLSIVFDTLKGRLTEQDFLFIFTTDHGGQSETDPEGAVIYLWGDYIDNVEFGAEVDKLTAYDAMVIAMEQCYSGGFEKSLAAKNRVFMSAASYSQVSWAMGPDYQYDEFSYYLTCGLNGARPDGGGVNADADGDGAVSFAEAYSFALANDAADETPQFNDQAANVDVSSMMGAGVVSLDGRFGLVFSCDSSASAVAYNIVQKGASGLGVYTADCAQLGDKWQVALGKKAPMAAVGSGSTSNWFSPAFVKGNGKKTATISYVQGNDVFPAVGLVKFVQPNHKKNQQLTVSR